MGGGGGGARGLDNERNYRRFHLAGKILENRASNGAASVGDSRRIRSNARLKGRKSFWEQREEVKVENARAAAASLFLVALFAAIYWPPLALLLRRIYRTSKPRRVQRTLYRLSSFDTLLPVSQRLLSFMYSRSSPSARAPCNWVMYLPQLQPSLRFRISWLAFPPSASPVFPVDGSE